MTNNAWKPAAASARAIPSASTRTPEAGSISDATTATIPCTANVYEIARGRHIDSGPSPTFATATITGYVYKQRSARATVTRSNATNMHTLSRNPESAVAARLRRADVWRAGGGVKVAHPP